MNTVVGDFRQEIAAGSTLVTPSPTPTNGAYTYFYSPNGAAAAPCLSGTVLADGLPNLVKRSAYQQPFYTGSSYTPSTGVARAANSSSGTASLNGRAISSARWNKALLLPKASLTSDTDFTPAAPAGKNNYVPPDWIVVARDGSNPVAGTRP